MTTERTTDELLPPDRLDAQGWQRLFLRLGLAIVLALIAGMCIVAGVILEGRP